MNDVTQPLQPEDVNLSGEEVKGYELIRRIGIGGMGAVYEGHQKTVDRRVAVKVILPSYASKPDFIRRFEIEAHLVARLEHPFIVPLYDYWRSPEGAFIIMRYLESGSLRGEMERRGTYSPAETARMLDQIAGALDLAHRNGVIHRDMKPDNILIDGTGNYYLSDFGIALDLSARDALENIEAENKAGMVSGSPKYMSPEQIQSMYLTPQTDLYSLGYIAYEMLTGEHAYFDAIHSMSILLYKHLQDPIPEIPDMPDEVNAVLVKATAKDPEDRYETAGDMARAFREALGETVSAPPTQRVVAPRSLVGDEETAIYGTTQRIAAIIVNPYKGLEPFEEADAGDFFGRDELKLQIIRRLRETTADSRFLAVIGPSGSGKSSVVKAGVIPALRQGGLDGSEEWFYDTMTPGTDPVGNLAEVIISKAGYAMANMKADLRADLLNNPSILPLLLDEILPEGDGVELVLLIDQFEEVFTLTTDEAERVAFMEMLRAAVLAENTRFRLIITLRADFYDRPLYYEGFGRLVEARHVTVLPLSTAELQQAITGPAEKVGIDVEPALTAAIIAEVGQQPGALPLMQYALTETFAGMEDQRMTLDAYQHIGGISGALARRAEDVYKSLNANQQEVARQMFLRLVNVRDEGEETRRRARWTELRDLAGGANIMIVVREAFARFRLLTSDHDLQTREPTVELAHEALIRQWERLREWIDDSRLDLLLQRQLAGFTQEWLAHDQARGYLLIGPRLTQFEGLAERENIALTPDETAFLEASIQRREDEARAERERAERERKLEEQARSRLRVLLIGATAAAVIGLSLAFIAFTQSQRAQTEAESRATQQSIAEANAAIAGTQQNVAEANAARAATQQAIAENNEREARSLLWTNSAQLAFRNNQTDLALALALQAVDADNPPPDAVRQLAEIAYAPGIKRVFTGHETGVRSVDVRSDGTLAATGDIDGTVIVWEPDTLETLQTLAAHTGRVSGVQFLERREQLITAGEDGDIVLWDVQSGEEINRFAAPNPITAVAVSGDERLLLAAYGEEAMLLWNLESGEVERSFRPLGSNVNAVALNADGTRALAGEDNRTVTLLDATDGRIIRGMRGHDDWVFTVAFTPDPNRVLSGAFDDTIILWDVNDGRALRRFRGHEDSVWQLQVMDRGRRVLSASADGTLLVWDVGRGQPLHRLGAEGTGHDDAVLGVAVTEDGRTAVSVSSDGRAIVWAAQTDANVGELRPGHRAVVTDVAISPDGASAISAAFDQRATVWDLATGEALHAFDTSGSDTFIDGVAYYPDGGRALLVTGDVRVIEVNVDLDSDDLGSVVRVFEDDNGHDDAITSVAISTGRERVVTGSADGTAIVWDDGAVEQRLEVGAGVTSVAINAEATRVLTGDADGQMTLWDTANGERLQAFDSGADTVMAVAFAPDGVLAGSSDGGLTLWNPDSGEAVREYAGHDEVVWDIAVSEDGSTLMSASGDGTLILWDEMTGAVRFRYGRVGEAGKPTIALGDGLALSGSDDGRLTLWQVNDLAGLKAWATENRYIPDWTCAQREQYGIPPLCDAASG